MDYYRNVLKFLKIDSCIFLVHYTEASVRKCYKKSALKNSAKRTGKHLRRMSSFKRSCWLHAFVDLRLELYAIVVG